MYKNILKSTKYILKKEKFINNLYKNIGKKPHSVLNAQPHFIFSAEESRFPRKYQMDHEQAMDFLTNKGYNIEEIQGKYDGQTEKSILIHNPPQHSIKHLFKLAHGLGQESSMYSDGYNHELHFHHGDNAGQHIKGQGTNYHKKEPDDYYFSLNDGTHFTHNLNFDELHPQENSSIKQKTKLNKSERNDNRLYLCKNEKSHPLEVGNPDTKLIHYSPNQGLKELDPHFHGVRGIGSEAKQGKPSNPMSFFYLEGTEPKSVVTAGAKSKYISKLGDRKLYDIGKDK